jgi:GT2 family glycosyltransferase
MTLSPIKTLDLELADGIVDIPVPAKYRCARVLIRWTGTPLGTINMPIRGGAIRQWEVAARVAREMAWPLAREAVRRAIVRTGVPAITRPLEDFPTSTNSEETLPTITIAICTRDRADDLRVCLDSLAKIEYSRCEYIIVDNAPSTDATAALVRAHYPWVRYVREERPGLNNARNRAIQEARTDIIGFMDDDVIVDPFWARAVAKVFARDSTVGLVTGLVEPAELETEAQVLFECYGGFGRGYFPHFMRAPYGRRMPWHTAGAGKLGAGASMAYRREIFERIGLFDPALDAGTPTLNGGDHEMFFRVLKADYGCVYEPKVLSRHRHRRSMEELSYLLYAYGRGTRCFFERTAREFPGDSRAIKRLTLWWWRRWGLGRWLLALWKPSMLPARLVGQEIIGFWKARGVYARVRRQLVPDEKTRPDRFRRATPIVTGDSQRRTLGVIAIDVSKPVADLQEGREYDDVHIHIHWNGQPIGDVRMKSDRQVVSRRRVAYVIAQQHAVALLRPSAVDYNLGWSLFQADLVRRLCGEAPGREPLLDPEVGVSVVVATCDRPDALQRCLQRLTAVRTSRRVQFIVVDNRPGSAATRNVVREFKTIELIEEPRSGSSYARNTGIRAAREEIVAMTDDDMIVSIDWLEQLLAPFDRRDVVAVTGNTMPARLMTKAEQLFEYYGGFGRGPASFEFDKGWLVGSRWRAATTWKLGGTGNAAFRREIFSDPEIGYFDESLGSGVPTGVGEDTKLFYDILHAGGVIVYQPSARAWHHHRIDMSNLVRQLYSYNRGHIAYHLATFIDHRDGRALFRIFIQWPLSILKRALLRLRRQTQYPLALLAVEVAGALAGPWGLWRARRRVRRLAKKCSQTAVSRATVSEATRPFSA